MLETSMIAPSCYSASTVPLLDLLAEVERDVGRHVVVRLIRPSLFSGQPPGNTVPWGTIININAVWTAITVDCVTPFQLANGMFMSRHLVDRELVRFCAAVLTKRTVCQVTTVFVQAELCRRLARITRPDNDTAAGLFEGFPSLGASVLIQIVSIKGNHNPSGAKSCPYVGQFGGCGATENSNQTSIRNSLPNSKGGSNDRCADDRSDDIRFDFFEHGSSFLHQNPCCH